MVMAGVDLASVKDLMGHKTIQMTLRYSHLSSKHLKDAVNGLMAPAVAKEPVADRRAQQPAVNG